MIVADRPVLDERSRFSGRHDERARGQAEAAHRHRPLTTGSTNGERASDVLAQRDDDVVVGLEVAASQQAAELLVLAGDAARRGTSMSIVPSPAAAEERRLQRRRCGSTRR